MKKRWFPDKKKISHKDSFPSAFTSIYIRYLVTTPAIAGVKVQNSILNRINSKLHRTR